MVALQTSRFQLLYNPFVYIAGWTSVLLAIVVVFTISVFCYLTGTHHYGLLNINFAKDTVFRQFFLEHFVHWSTSIALLYGAGVLLSVSSIRFIDVAGTLGLARFPLIILSLVRFLPPFESFVINSLNMYFCLYFIFVWPRGVWS